MTATLTTTEDDILKQLKTVWDAAGATTGIALVYRNVDVAEGVVAPPDGNVAWARASVETTFSGQTTFGHNQRRFLNSGLLSVEIFTPVGVGQKQAKNIADVVFTATRGVRTSNGVIFRDANIVTVGVQGKWFRLNVLVVFEVDEFV